MTSIRRTALPVSLLLGAVVFPPAVEAGIHLEPCSPQGAAARCGTHTVVENRATGEGRTLDLNIVVLPARGDEPKPDPIFFLHGGPGGAATDLAPMFAHSPLRRERDIVLVDQRGTGASNPLECEPETLQQLLETMATFEFSETRRCLENYDADLTLYTTTVAMADLDEVRRELGYEKINLFGGSYGTRAALEYLRRYPKAVRTAYLRGVHPPSGVLPVNFDRDSQAALDDLIADCRDDKHCRADYPDLAAKIRKVVKRLAEKPAELEMRHPLTGNKEPVAIDDRIFRGLVHYTLYDTGMAARLPAMIDEAADGHLEGIVDNVLQFATMTGASISFGMFLSVVCAEDAPFIDREAVARDAQGTLLEGMMSRGLLSTCADWPRGELAEDYKEPVRSEVPVLIVSGEVDPVTAPHLAAAAAKELANSIHVVVPDTSHGNWTPGCTSELLAKLLETGSVAGLDGSCAREVKRPRFRD